MLEAAHTIDSGVYGLKGKRVLVTGGAGFVGSYLVEDLLEHGADVRVVDDLSSGSEDYLPRSDVEFVAGDLTDPSVAHGAVAGMDVVLRLAARAYGMLRSME